jgi:hypothetical protein
MAATKAGRIDHDNGHDNNGSNGSCRMSSRRDTSRASGMYFFLCSFFIYYYTNVYVRVGTMGATKAGHIDHNELTTATTADTTTMTATAAAGLELNRGSRRDALSSLRYVHFFLF